MLSKPFYKSSTVLINLVGLVVLVLDFVVQSNFIPDAEIVALVVAVLNILNRLRAPKRIQPLSLR